MSARQRGTVPFFNGLLSRASDLMAADRKPQRRQATKTNRQPAWLLDALVGRNVVVDVSSEFVYVGRLTGGDEKYLLLEQADVHDLRDTTTTRENYVVDSRRLGVRTNRERVLVRLEEVVSISALDDVIV